MKILILLLLSLFLFWLLYGENYSFDASEFEKKPYEFLFSIKLGSNSLKYNDSAIAYSQNYSTEISEYDFDYYSSLQLKGSYEIDKFKFSATALQQLDWDTDENVNGNFSVLESFINYDISTRFNLTTGKIVAKTGKGYLWNPASFAGHEKDVNDLEASLEGYSMIKLDYVRAFTSNLSNISASLIFIPVNEDINPDYSNEPSWHIVSNNYFLINDNDLSFNLHLGEEEVKKIGFEFARNLLTNWEIHGEFSRNFDSIKHFIDTDNYLAVNHKPRSNYILGTRILFTSNTTIIAEFLHNDTGLSNLQYENIFSGINNMSELTSQQINDIIKVQTEQVNKQLAGQNYIYTKFSQPEPFDILYLNPANYTLINLDDNSGFTGLEISYSRFNNILLKAKYNLFWGDNLTEFGEKINNMKLKFEVEYTF